jgi:hypothetical protein
MAKEVKKTMKKMTKKQQEDLHEMWKLNREVVHKRLEYFIFDGVKYIFNFHHHAKWLRVRLPKNYAGPKRCVGPPLGPLERPLAPTP